MVNWRVVQVLLKARADPNIACHGHTREDVTGKKKDYIEPMMAA